MKILPKKTPKSLSKTTTLTAPNLFLQTCATGSLDGYDVKKLISTAVTSAMCFVEARNEFKRTYGTAKFIIEGPLATDEDEDGSITETNKQIIHIKNVAAVENTLKLFGDMVHFIELSFTDIDEMSATTISTAVVENCANSLIELQLKSCYGTILNSFQTAFPNVNVTAFSTHLSKPLQIGTDTWKLNRLFPHAKQLSVDIQKIDYWTVVGDSFPQLKMLSAIHPKPTYSALPDIGSLLNSSRSINSLALWYTSMALLKTANEALPALNVLQLNEFSDDFYTGTAINFQNVSNLRIITSINNAQVPEKLHFNGVKALTLSLGYDFTDKWLQFVRKISQRVEWLAIKTLAINADELKTIAQDSLNLKLVSITTVQKMPTTEIISFLEHSQQLEWLEMECARIDNAERNILEGWLERTWFIEYLQLTDQLNHMRFTR